MFSVDDRPYVARSTHVFTYSGVNEEQRIGVGGLVTSGTYTLTFKGTKASPLVPPQTTAPIEFNAPAAEVEAALVGLPAIESEDVAVVERPEFFGHVHDVTFTGAYATKDMDRRPTVGAWSAAAVRSSSWSMPGKGRSAPLT